MLTRPQFALIAHAVLLIGALAVLVPLLTAWNSQLGYLLVLLIYWLGFCVPVILRHVWKRHDGRLFSERLAWRDWFIPLLLLIQVGATALASFMPNTAQLTTQGAMLAGLVALLNGPLQETAWRGGFMTTFADRPRLGFVLCWLLFTAWHIPLTLSHGLTFEGGALALVASAALLGLFWGWIAWRTGSVFYTAIAHTITNAVTFWVLFNENGFVAPHP